MAQSNPELWRKMEGQIWWGAEETDPVATKIEEAIAAIEVICRPILQEQAK
jgi:hypothetical protein